MTGQPFLNAVAMKIVRARTVGRPTNIFPVLIFCPTNSTRPLFIIIRKIVIILVITILLIILVAGGRRNFGGGNMEIALYHGFLFCGYWSSIIRFLGFVRWRAGFIHDDFFWQLESLECIGGDWRFSLREKMVLITM